MKLLKPKKRSHGSKLVLKHVDIVYDEQQVIKRIKDFIFNQAIRKSNTVCLPPWPHPNSVDFDVEIFISDLVYTLYKRSLNLYLPIDKRTYLVYSMYAKRVSLRNFYDITITTRYEYVKKGD